MPSATSNRNMTTCIQSTKHPHPGLSGVQISHPMPISFLKTLKEQNQIRTSTISDIIIVDHKRKNNIQELWRGKVKDGNSGVRKFREKRIKSGKTEESWAVENETATDASSQRRCLSPNARWSKDIPKAQVPLVTSNGTNIAARARSGRQIRFADQVPAPNAKEGVLMDESSFSRSVQVVYDRQDPMSPSFPGMTAKAPAIACTRENIGSLSFTEALVGFHTLERQPDELELVPLPRAFFQHKRSKKPKTSFPASNRMSNICVLGNENCYSSTTNPSERILKSILMHSSPQKRHSTGFHVRF